MNRLLTIINIVAVGLLIFVAALAVWLACGGKARADLGNMGPGPAPGLCPYPSVCDVGMAGGVMDYYWYQENWPVELNGTHRHCYAYMAATEGNAQIGFAMFLEISAGLRGPVGAMVGGCHYVCPDGQLGSIPNPVGGYKDAIIPTRCKPVGPNPDMPVPVSPPIAEQGAVPAIPFGQPQPPEGAPFAPPEQSQPGPAEVSPEGPPLAEKLPSQTNPVCPSPAATTTETCDGK